MSTDRRRLGDSNWRPRRVSTGVGILVCVTTTVGLAVVAGATIPAVVGLVAGLCLGCTVWATAVTERRLATPLAGVAAAVSGGTLLVGLAAAAAVQTGWPPTPPVDILAAAPFFLLVAGLSSGFGAVVSVWGVTPVDGAGTALKRLLVVVSVPLAVLIVSLAEPPLDPVFRAGRLGIDLALARGTAAVPIRIDGIAAPRLGGFLATVSVAAFSVSVALNRLPLVELAAERYRESVETVVGRVNTLLAAAFALCCLFSVAAVVLQPRLSAAYVEVPPEMLSHLVAVTLSTTLRWAFLLIAVSSVFAVVCVRLVRSLASEQFRPDALPFLSLTVGGGLTAVAALAHSSIAVAALERAESDAGRQFLEGLFSEIGSFPLVLAVVTGGLLITTTLLIAILLAGAFRFLGSAMGVQAASAGVFIAAVAAALAGGPVPIVIAGVAASLLVWDLGEFGGTLGNEIGRAGDGRRGEFVHVVGAAALATGSVIVGGVAVAAVGVLPQISDAAAVLVAVTAAIGALLLLLVIR